METKKNRINLTDTQRKLLNNIINKTKLDNQIMLDKDKDGFDCVYNLERKQKVTLRFAVQQLNTIIACKLSNFTLLDVTIAEMYMYSELLEMLEIKNNPFEEEIIIQETVYSGNANGIWTD